MVYFTGLRCVGLNLKQTNRVQNQRRCTNCHFIIYLKCKTKKLPQVVSRAGSTEASTDMATISTHQVNGEQTPSGSREEDMLPLQRRCAQG